MNPIFISIVIPAYNAELHIDKAIYSVLGQVYEYFEVIIIDDASKDDTWNKCCYYAKKDKRIRLFHMERNSGVSCARNKGIELAKGELIAFVDSDDIISPQFLSNLLQSKENVDLYLSLYKKKEYTGVEYNVELDYCGYYKFDDINLILDLQKRTLLSTPCGKLYRRCIIQNNCIQFDTRFQYGEDTLFVTNYLIFVSDVYISNTLDYIYMHTGNGLSSGRPPFESLLEWSCTLLKMRKKLSSSFAYSEKYLAESCCEYFNYLATSLYSLFSGRRLYDKYEIKERILLLKNQALWADFSWCLRLKLSTFIFIISLRIFPVNMVYMLYRSVFKISKK